MPTTTTTTLTAREYLRVSFDTSGRERSNDEQHDDNQRGADEHGWELGAPYRDTGSASRHARKARAGFDRLIDDLEHDRFGADLLVLWESSRGSRRVGEWVTLVELCEERQVRIFVTTHGRTYDPANPRDRRSLLEDSIDAEYESAKTSMRSKRAAAASAAAGRPHGRVPFGYRRVYDDRSGRLIGQEPDPAEAPVVVELFDRLAAGHSLKGIARDFADRGITSRTGKALTSEVLRPMALAPLYIGKRAHAPGDMTRKERDRRATLVDATWPAIVDPATFHAVRTRLTDPSRRTSRPGSGVHLLSMIARCDVCSGSLAATYRHRDRREYQCHVGGHVRIAADDLDAVATERILEYLCDPERAGVLTADDDTNGDVTAARGVVAQVRAELDDLADQVGRGLVSATLAARAEPAILARLREAERRVDELITPPTLRAFAGPSDEMHARWGAAPMSAKREAARMLLAANRVGELRVERSPGGPVPATDRSRFVTTVD